MADPDFNRSNNAVVSLPDQDSTGSLAPTVLSQLLLLQQHQPYSYSMSNNVRQAQNQNLPISVLLALQLAGSSPSQTRPNGTVTVVSTEASLRAEHSLAVDRALPAQTGTNSFQTSFASGLSTTIINQHDNFSASSIHEAIAKEKTRLLQSIMGYRQAESASYPSLVGTAAVQHLPVEPQQQDLVATAQRLEPQQHDPATVRMVEAIGAKIRNGEPFIDVTVLPGINHAQAVPPPRINRGGVLETFPEVSPLYDVTMLLIALSHSPTLLTIDRNSTACSRTLKRVGNRKLCHMFPMDEPLWSMTLISLSNQSSRGISITPHGSL
jgi:hypothetical protein